MTTFKGILHDGHEYIAPPTAIPERIERRASESQSARAIAAATTARLARLQSITAALSNTVTQDAVAHSVLHEAIIALECDAGVVVVTNEAQQKLTLLREAGTLDTLMRSFENEQPDSLPGPYAETVEKGVAIYLESFEEMLMRYPGFRTVSKPDSRGAWIFLPLAIDGHAVGALAFGFAKPRKFTVLDRDFADTVSRYCAQAMDRVRLRVAAAAALAEAGEARLMAEEANNAKTVFLRAMSHELRTPAAYLLRLISDVLTVAKLEGARPLRLASIAMKPILAEVEGLCALQARAKRITLTVTPGERDLAVAADAERLQQILLNLITNAIKFTDAGGSVKLTCRANAKMVDVRVTDSGVGIKAADVNRVFEPFVQIDRHLTSDTQQGVGLGLSISRELARAMLGDLTLQSIEGVGSAFTLTLPIASAASLALSTER